MGFFKRLRAKVKGAERKNGSSRKSTFSDPYQQGHQLQHYSYQHSSRPARDFTKSLPPEVLRNIFALVCPHSLDDSLASSEESVVEDGCMLCDLRNLAHCALVCRRWYSVAQNLLYVLSRIPRKIVLFLSGIPRSDKHKHEVRTEF